MLGREVNQPVGLILPIYQHRASILLRRSIPGLACIAHETARNTLKTMVSIKFLEHFYKVGDVVYFLDTAKVKFKSRKLNI